MFNTFMSTETNQCKMPRIPEFLCSWSEMLTIASLVLNVHSGFSIRVGEGEGGIYYWPIISSISLLSICLILF